MTKLRGLTFAAIFGTALLFFGCGKKDGRTVNEPATSPQSSEIPAQPDSGATVRPSITDAARLLQHGDSPGAEKIVRELLVESPRDVAANTLLASILAQRGEFSDAVAALDELALTNPAERDRIEAQAADLAFASGDLDEAIDRFEALIGRFPKFDLARRRLAHLLNQRGDRFDANEHLRDLAGRMSLNRDELRGLSYPMLAWINVSEKPNIHDSKQIRRLGLLTAARALYSQGDVRECIELFDLFDRANQTESRLTSAAVVAFRLWAISAAQDFDALQNAIISAQPTCQRYPEYWLAAGSLALHQHNQAAMTCFAEAIRREPNCLEAHDGFVQAAQQADQTAWADMFRNRKRQVERVQRLTGRIVTSEQLVQEDFLEVTELSKDMGRPLESLLWQELMFNRISPSVPQLRVLHDYKTEVLARFPRGVDNSALLCGINIDDITSPEKWLATLRQKHGGQPLSHEINQTKQADTTLSPATPVFRNVAALVGATFCYKNAAKPVPREFQIFQAYGSGVACFDFDLDGRVDFYLGQAASTPPNELASDANALFRNLGERFVDIIEISGSDDRRYTTGITSGDWNQDGFPDLAIANLGGNRLLTNQGDGTFQEHFVDSLWDKSEYTTSLAIADISGDGLADIVEVNYLDDPAIFEPIQYDGEGKPVMLPGPLHFQPGLDRVFVSLGDGTFRSQLFGEPQAIANRSDLASTGLGLLVTDLDGDLANDVFVANDLRANQFWLRAESTSNESISFSDVAVARGVAYGNSGQPMACMGIAAADFDGNGRIDLHITNFDDQWSNQYMQNESGVFVDRIVPLGLDAGSRNVVGFGTQALDYDNNTTWDLVVGNGHVEDFTAQGKLFEMPTQLFANDGIRFTQVAAAGDNAYWKTDHLSRGLAKCDWNRDGRIDFVVTDLRDDFALLENDTETTNHWLQIELVATQAERDAIGAKVTVQVGSRTFTQTVQTGDGYLSKNESILSFGLGSGDPGQANAVNRISVRWPRVELNRSGESESDDEQVFENIRGDSRILVIQNEKTAWFRSRE